MNPDFNQYLKQLRREAQIEQLLHSRQEHPASWANLEKYTIRLLYLRFLGIRLEIRKRVAT